MPRGAFFDSIASVLHHVLHRHGMETKVFEHKLRRQWSDVVSEPIAAHTRPDQIRFKKLYLIVDNSVWLQQLTFLKPTLLETINAAAGSPIVSDIVLRVGEVRAQEENTKVKGKSEDPGSSPEPGDADAVMAQESIAQAEAHAAAVTDPELRSRLTEVMAHALAQRPAPRRSKKLRP